MNPDAKAGSLHNAYFYAMAASGVGGGRAHAASYRPAMRRYQWSGVSARYSELGGN